MPRQLFIGSCCWVLHPSANEEPPESRGLCVAAPLLKGGHLGKGRWMAPAVRCRTPTYLPRFDLGALQSDQPGAGPLAATSGNREDIFQESRCRQLTGQRCTSAPAKTSPSLARPMSSTSIIRASILTRRTGWTRVPSLPLQEPSAGSHRKFAFLR